MSLHPAVAKKAQTEIDSVTEQERLPTFDDWERLPYVGAIILEVLRVNTVTPLGASGLSSFFGFGVFWEFEFWI